MDRPSSLASLAEDLHAARRPRLEGIEHDLHLAAISVCLVLVVLLEDQRVVQLHILYDRRSASLEAYGRDRHGAVECAGRHDAVEHPVIVKPLRIRGEDFRLKRRLAASGFVPDSQQGVIGAPAPVPWRLKPMAPALEWIGRQRDPSPRLPREQPCEMNREPHPVSFRDRLHEIVVTCRRVTERRIQARQHHGRRRLWRFRPRRNGHRSQHRARADLHHQVHAEIR